MCSTCWEIRDETNLTFIFSELRELGWYGWYRSNFANGVQLACVSWASNIRLGIIGLNLDLPLSFKSLRF
jgi:hypothetical protein